MITPNDEDAGARRNETGHDANRRRYPFLVAWIEMELEFAEADHGIDDQRGVEPPASDAKYLGVYRHEQRVIFAYLEGGQRKYRTVSAHGGRVVESLVAELRDKPTFRYFAGGEATYAIAWSEEERRFVTIWACC